MPRTPKIEIFATPKRDLMQQDRHFIRVRAANGEIVVVSEGYASKSIAKKAAKRLGAIVAKAVIVELDS